MQGSGQSPSTALCLSASRSSVPKSKSNWLRLTRQRGRRPVCQAPGSHLQAEAQAGEVHV